MPRELRLIALPGIPEIEHGAALCDLLLTATARANLALQTDDILVLAQKIISKAEGRVVQLASVAPSARALDIAKEANKDPRIVELILRESRQVLRVKPGIIIVEHQLGFVMANAGIDQSNVPGAEDAVLLLPEDPDDSARKLRDELHKKSGVEAGVLIIDSFGRAWRNGVTGTAIGVAGLPALIDLRGNYDREGRALKVTQVAAADELAAAASLVMGQADEGTPAVLVRGFPYALRDGSVQELLRPKAEDLFR
jgi:coenzyme F420-0:L-glutamate ligase / coenzyme F420-1:gamma-L-glutamate ligase